MVGLPDERWGKIVAAFIKRRHAVSQRRSRSVLPDVGPRQFQAAAPLRLRRRRFRNRRSASCLRRMLVAGEYEAESAIDHLQSRKKRMTAMNPMTFSDPRLADARRLPRRGRRGARARRHRPRPAAVQHRLDAAARPAAPGVRGARRGRARARHRAARGRRAFLQRRQHQGLPRGVARARLQARLEHRGAGALRQAGDRRQPRLSASASVSSCRSPATSASSRRPASTRCRSRSSGRSRARAARRGCRRSSASPAPRTS